MSFESELSSQVYDRSVSSEYLVSMHFLANHLKKQLGYKKVCINPRHTMRRANQTNQSGVSALPGRSTKRIQGCFLTCREEGKPTSCICSCSPRTRPYIGGKLNKQLIIILFIFKFLPVASLSVT